MAGTKAGGKLAAETNKSRHGDDYYVKLGAMGGRASTGYGFGHGKVDPSVAGKLGGAKSKRGPSKKVVEAIKYDLELEHLDGSPHRIRQSLWQSVKGRIKHG